MKYRPLGNTGIQVSEVGFGTWGLGGDAYGPTDDVESRRALARALDEGITFYDTSDMYGNGRSETLLGEVFAGARDRVVIATKGGMLPHSTFHMPQDFSPSHLRDALEGSLRRLRTDHVDLYQLHSPELEVLAKSEETLHTLEELRRAGKVRALGISTRSPDDAKVAIDEYGFATVQVNFNLLDQRALDNGLLGLAQSRGVGIVVRTPLVFGFLTGQLSGDEKFAGGDHRANWPKDQLERWAKAARIFADLADGTGRTQVQTALRFCLDHAAVSVVIPGMMTVQQVLEDGRASDLPPLTGADYARIRALYEANEFYDRTAKSRGRQ